MQEKKDFFSFSANGKEKMSIFAPRLKLLIKIINNYK